MLIMIVLHTLFIMTCTSEAPQGLHDQTQEKTTGEFLYVPEKIYVVAAIDEDGWRDYYFALNSLEEWKDNDGE